jgi:general secretion pathway protein I
MKTQSGLTLIEVLIALAIVAIAMTAVIKATGQNIRGTTYLQDKTIAMWVGQQVLNEARLGLLSIPPPPDKLKETTTMLGQDWYWRASQEDTHNNHIKKVEVRVYSSDTDDDDAASLISMETYLYHAE